MFSTIAVGWSPFPVIPTEQFQNYGYFKREKNGCTGTGARTKLHKIKKVIFFTQCMWCYDAFLVTKYVIVTFSRKVFCKQILMIRLNNNTRVLMLI